MDGICTLQTALTPQCRTPSSVLPLVRQVLFGLRSSERLVASTSCILAPPVGGPAAAAAAAAAAVAAAGGSAGLVAAAATGGSSTPSVTAGPGREGTLYVTQRVLAYTTMLASDLRTTTDVTLKLQLKVGRKARTMCQAPSYKGTAFVKTAQYVVCRGTSAHWGPPLQQQQLCVTCALPLRPAYLPFTRNSE